MGARTQLLDCDIAAHDRVEINVCEAIPWHAQCEAAVTAINIAEIVKHCNFTKHEKHDTGTVRHDGSVLVQGMDVKIRLRKNNDIRVINNEAPVIVYTNGEIILEENGETYVFPGLKQTMSDEIIITALDKTDIKKLENAYYWQNFWQNFDTEDVIDAVLIAVEVIMLPTSIVGLVYGVLAARSTKKKEAKKRNFEHNRLILKKQTAIALPKIKKTHAHTPCCYQQSWNNCKYCRIIKIMKYDIFCFVNNFFFFFFSSFFLKISQIMFLKFSPTNKQPELWCD
jgi:hypothetical protein